MFTHVSLEKVNVYSTSYIHMQVYKGKKTVSKFQHVHKCKVFQTQMTPINKIPFISSGPNLSAYEKLTPMKRDIMFKRKSESSLI